MTAPRSTAFRYRRLASIAAGGLATALALSVAVRAWAQTSPDSSPRRGSACREGSWTSAAMSLRPKDFCSTMVSTLRSCPPVPSQERRSTSTMAARS
jgi:hypothetical protein